VFGLTTVDKKNTPERTSAPATRQAIGKSPASKKKYHVVLVVLLVVFYLA